MCLYFNNVVFLIMFAINMVKSTSGSKRMVGGAECNIEDYPFMVSLRHTKSLEHFCGGALISEKWILSAAHCTTGMTETPEVLTAVFGEQRKDGTTHGQMIPAREIFNHPEYERSHHKNDICLVLLNSKVNFIVGILDTLELPRSLYKSEDLTLELPARQLIIAGWGTTEKLGTNDQYTAIASQALKCVNVSYITFEECVHRWDEATRNQICTYNIGGGQAHCYLDAGGPLFQGRTIYGIISYSYGCAMPERPSFYTRVDKYLDFIDKTMRACGNKPTFSFSILTVLGVFTYLNIFYGSLTYRV